MGFMMSYHEEKMGQLFSLGSMITISNILSLRSANLVELVTISNVFAAFSKSRRMFTVSNVFTTFSKPRRMFTVSKVLATFSKRR